MIVLEIKNLCKSFGTHAVINDLSFNVTKGSIYGFLGQNGAGKTTTMKMVLGLLKPDSGIINVCGETVRYGETQTNKFIGFLPDVPEFYGYMRPMEYLALCGEVTGLDRNQIPLRSKELLALVGLENLRSRIGTYSRGMKQRLGIAQALLNKPRLLICDEPTSALDPMGRKEILDILLSVKGETTIVFSTHILTDVERICDHVAVLNKGSIVLDGSLADLKQNHNHHSIRIEFSTESATKNFLSHMTADLYNVILDNSTLLVSSSNMDATKESIFNLFAQTGIYPVKIEHLERNLEDLFMEVVR